ncbi:MAG TPA: hypothetical protein VF094_08530 [Gaiellaceae bacterium]
MPVGYLWTTLVAPFCAGFAVAAPPAKRPNQRNLRYCFAFLIHELPFLAFYWLLASTLLAASEGDLSSPVGWIALVVSGAHAERAALPAGLRGGRHVGHRRRLPVRLPRRLLRRRRSRRLVAVPLRGRGRAAVLRRARDRDTIVPVADARAFAESLRATASPPVAYAALPGAHHTFDLFRSLRFERVVDGIQAFADRAARESRRARDLTE